MKDHGDLRKSGRPGYTRRVLASNRARLSSLWGEDGAVVRQPDHRVGKKNTLCRPHTNWIVRRDGDTVIAVEPSREHENVFDGGDDPFMVALEFAAAQLRKELDDA